MERWHGRVAVVTGASAGIGAAIAYHLLDSGVNVVGLARRKDKITVAVQTARADAGARLGRCTGRPASSGTLHCVQCDVSREEDVIAAFKWVKDNLGTVHILVNNAGRFGLTPLTGTNTAEWKGILDLNVLGLSMCTREAIQLMREKGVDDGHIVHIGSVLGHLNPTGGEEAFYSASKHAVRVLTEGLRKELVASKSKIRVTEVSPGLVRTEILEPLGINLESVWNKPHLFAEDVADAVLYALGTPSHVQIHEVMLRHVGDAF